MKIQSSAVSLMGQYQRELLASKTIKAEVNQGDGRSSHGVKLKLNTSTHQQQSINARSQVSGAGTYQYHANEFAARQITQALFQQTISVNNWQGNLQETAQGRSIEIESIEQVNFFERLSFEAQGKVTTADGRQIDFLMALDFSRDITEEQSAYFKGNVQLVDPLMINLDGGAVTLTNQYFDFDLMADGSNVKINQTAKGTGYLVFDRNNDGVVNDGSELFGPQSGNGFAELSLYDSDGNGWIDENDDIYSQLGVMTFNEQGEAVYQSAKDAGLGALYLGSIGSNYALLDNDGELLGSIQQTGVALAEDGKTLLLQEVHLRYEMEQQTQLKINFGNGRSTITNAPLSPPIPVFNSAEMRDRVAQSMRSFSLEDEQQGLELGLRIENSFSVTRESEHFSLQVDDKDGKISHLRQVVEMLKEMREAQKLQQKGQQPLGIYQFVQKLPNQQ